MHPLRVGLKLAPQLTTVDELRAVWRVADEAGFDHCWNFDHFAALGDDPAGDVLEAWSLLGAMAEATTRVRIGCMVTGITYRHPAVLAKTAVTVDRLSGGRLEMGIGAAWAEGEHAMLGLELGTRGERVDRLAEAVAIMKLLWTGERSTYHGRYYRIEDALANPKPVQQPYPPIWIGGRGPRKTLRLVAEQADVWNAPWGTPDELSELSAVLDRHCADVGRDPLAVRRSAQFPYAADDDAALALTADLLGRGITEIVLMLPAGRAEQAAEAAAVLLPRLRQLGS